MLNIPFLIPGGAPCVGQATQYKRCNEKVPCDWNEFKCNSGAKVRGFRVRSSKQSSSFNQMELICENGLTGAITRVKTAAGLYQKLFSI